MKNFIGFALIPMACLVVMILTAVVVIFALRRGTRAINDEVRDIVDKQNGTSGENTRWARGDLEGAPRIPKKEKPRTTCPACGGENPAKSRACAYCGRNL